MSTPFDEWLRGLRAAGKLVDDGITIDRGMQFFWKYGVRGAWTSPTGASSLRLSPDAGSALASFTTSYVGTSTVGAVEVDHLVTLPGHESDTTMAVFTLYMSVLDISALPADGDGDGVVSLAWDVLFAASNLNGGAQMRLFGGEAKVLGQVT